tara:strand:- start:112 stop:1032 length:921 start_codon:yes stop_codon:yes gene_type:complete
MSNLTIKGKNFNPKNVSISDKPSVMESGAKYVWVGYEHSGSPKNLVLQTPYMSLPFGMNCFDKGEYPKYSAELSFSGVETDKNLKSFYDNINSFDEFLVDAGVKNSMAWFKKKKASRDVIDAMFNRQIKVPTDKESGEELTQYPKRLRVKIPFRDDKFDCEVFDTKGNKIDSPLAEVLVRGSRVKAIIQCVGLWVSSSNYMCQWKLLRAEVDVPENLGSCNFLPDTDDECEEEGDVVKATEPVSEKVVSKTTVVEDSEDEDDEDDEDDEEDDDDDDDEEDSDDEPEPEPEPEPVKKKGKAKSKGKK